MIWTAQALQLLQVHDFVPAGERTPTLGLAQAWLSVNHTLTIGLGLTPREAFDPLHLATARTSRLTSTALGGHVFRYDFRVRLA